MYKRNFCRSSWVIGRGRNFVKTMRALSDRCASADDVLEQVTVVDDQAGRLTFTETMAGAIFHLLGYREGDMEPAVPAPYGLYNCINSGDAASWAQIAAMVFERVNGNGDKVQPVSTADYYANAAGPVAPRPEHSALDLSKLEAAGFVPADWHEELDAYMDELLAE